MDRSTYVNIDIRFSHCLLNPFSREFPDHRIEREYQGQSEKIRNCNNGVLQRIVKKNKYINSAN